MYLDVPIASSFCGSLILAISHYGGTESIPISKEHTCNHQI